MTELTNHPLMLTLKDTVSGDGFLAGITLSGRALVRKEEDDKWWMYGVRPAGLCESGDTVKEAFSRFRGRYTEILFDIAEESHDFETFKSLVEEFFHEHDADDEDSRLWEESLAQIRKGNIDPPDPFADLPRESPETKPAQIMVERLDSQEKRFLRSDNVRDSYSLACLPCAA
ncbi:MAG: hypothetical protein P4M01_13065 [Acidobacteriota bacterium]|nr:hypothetical protein [Acidobacteriota bacterium]